MTDARAGVGAETAPVAASELDVAAAAPSRSEPELLPATPGPSESEDQLPEIEDRRELGPRDHPPRGPWRLVRATLSEAWNHRILGLAAEAGFWQLLSLPPLLLALLGGVGYVGGLFGPNTVDRVETGLLSFASGAFTDSTVQDVIAPIVEQILRSGRADVLSVGFVIALWSGSTATSTFVNTITIAYDLRDVRGALRSRLLALVLYLGFIAVLVVVIPALVAGPDLLEALAPSGSENALQVLLRAAYWPVVVLIALSALTTLYHVSVPVRTAWRRDVPGAVLALSLWLVGCFGLRIYVTRLFGTTLSYGSLAAPIALLLFLWITALAILLGAHFNAQIDTMWPAPATSRARLRRSRLLAASRRAVGDRLGRQQRLRRRERRAIRDAAEAE